MRMPAAVAGQHDGSAGTACSGGNAASSAAGDRSPPQPTSALLSGPIAALPSATAAADAATAAASAAAGDRAPPQPTPSLPRVRMASII